MIFYDLLSENGGIRDSGHENVALRKNKDSESKEEIYIGQETIWKGTRYYDPKVKVSHSTQIGHYDFSVSYGKEKSFNFSHIDKNDCRVFRDLAKYRMCLSFVLPR